MLRRLRILPRLWKTGRLTARLVRDRRVPLATKAIVAATLLYLVSPLDVVPDWLPFVGQADDLVALLAGLNLFLRMCPRWLVEEHEDDLTGRREASTGDRDEAWYDDHSGGWRDEGYAAPDDRAPVGAAGRARAAGPVIEGQYRQVR